MSDRQHLHLPWPKRPYPLRRVVFWGAAWSFCVSSFMIDVLGLPFWSPWPLCMVLGFVLPVVVERRMLRTAWFRWKHRVARRGPIVLDEDGRIHHPPLVPYEEVVAVLYAGHPDDPDQVPLAAKVVTRDGRIIAEADWSARA